MPSSALHSKTLPSGATQYYAVWYDPERQPPRKWVTLRTSDKRTATLRYADAVKREAAGAYDPWTGPDLGGVGAAPRITVGDAVAAFIEHLERTARPNTVAQRRSALAHLVAVTERGQPMKSRPLSSLTPRHVQAAIDAPQGRGSTESAPVPAAATTRRAVYAAIDTFLAWCVRHGHATRHILRSDRPGAPRPIEPEPGGAEPFHVFEPRELAAAVAWLRSESETSSRHAGFVVAADAAELAVCSGLRVGELVQLTWGDVRTSEGGGGGMGAALDVVQSVRRGRTTKTGTSRRVVVWPLGARALERMRARAEEQLGRRVRASDPVALGQRGAVIDGARLNRLLRRACDATGIEHGVNWHDLRHTFISWSVNELAVPLTVVQSLAGHADVRRTASYQHVTARAMHESLDRALVLAGITSAGAEPTGIGDVARYVAGLPASSDDRAHPD